MDDFDWRSIPGALPFLWKGMTVSLGITVMAVVAGIVWGTPARADAPVAQAAALLARRGLREPVPLDARW